MKKLAISHHSITMLGRIYTDQQEDNNTLGVFQSDYEKLIYISYRKGIKDLLVRDNSEFLSQDTSNLKLI